MATNIQLSEQRARANEELFQLLLTITQSEPVAQLLMRNKWNLLNILEDWAEKVNSHG